MSANRYHNWRRWYDRRKAECIAYLGGVCQRCGAEDGLEFDHIDPSTKSGHITRMLHRPKEELLGELKKCQLLCELCHIEKSKSEVAPPAHGTLSRYGNRYRCRCDDCREASRVYGREYARKKRLVTNLSK